MNQNQSVVSKIIVLFAFLSMSACGGGSTPVPGSEEVAQALGDMVASVDESLSPDSGSITLPINGKEFSASCSSFSFNGCSDGIRTKEYGSGCTNLRGTTTLGTSTLVFSEASGCTLSEVGAGLTQLPSLRIEGRKGGTLTITSDSYRDYRDQTYGGGNHLVKVSSGYSWETLGTHREFKVGSEIQFKLSTRTISPIDIKGTSRADRTLSSGKVEISHNMEEYTGTFIPFNVKYRATCTCPVSGKFSGSLTGEHLGDMVIEFTGCGTARVTTNGGASIDISLERCNEVNP